MTSDGKWSYTWNAENRLIAMESITTIPDAARKKLTFSYDYVGRRYAKTVASWDSTTQAYQPQSKTLFLYDGWNLIAEIDADQGALTRSYTWGTDLSGSEQGAGGVGGLLMITEGADTYHLGYDFNGNVSCLIKNDLTTAATYDYSPFGKLITATGEYAKENPYKFSTKYEDAETGLLYYGYRYYQPEMGRWLNRDPLAENGGVNLYGMVNNNPISLSDYLGLDFIALGVRNLKDVEFFTFGVAYHSSIEYWESECPAHVDKEWKTSKFLKYSESATMKESVELMARDGWQAKQAIGSTRRRRNRTVDVKVSEIDYDSSTATRFVTFFEPKMTNANERKKNITDVKAAWKKVKNIAQGYKFAEQPGFENNFSNWPNSKYSLFGNNCHVFAGSTIRAAGYAVPDPSGLLLGIGNDPSNVGGNWIGVPKRRQ